MPKTDNTTLRRKVTLRLALLREFPDPIVCEAYGGYGRIYDRCYRDLGPGVVFEKDELKAASLAVQRPHWAVYEGDCVSALAAGCGRHRPVNFFDVDPYGQPWPAIDAFLRSDRPHPDRLGIVVQDGLRQKVQLTGGRNIKSLIQTVQRWGADHLYEHYLEACRELMTDKAAEAGYDLRRWTGYYCGRQNALTHYAAVLTRSGGSR